MVLILSQVFVGNHTIAVVKGKEEHETLKESLSNVIRDVNSLIDDGHMIIDGRKVSTEFFLGGDYKVIVVIYTNYYSLL